MMEIKTQNLLLEFLWKYAHKVNKLTRKDVIKKDLLCNNADFFKHINILIDFGYIKNNGHGCYCLTTNGWCFSNIIALQPNTLDKYRKIAREISWIP